LQKIASGDKDNFQKFWGEFGQVLKEGVVEDHANKDKLAKLLRFATTHSGTDSQDQSLADYLERAQKGQDKIYYILAETYATAAASPHLEQLKKRGIEVLLLTDRIDAWLADGLAEYDGKALVDVARAALDLPDDDTTDAQDAVSEEHDHLLERIQGALGDRVAAVKVSRRLVDSPACVVAGDDDLNPQIRRMLAASGQDVPDAKPILEINVGHPLVGCLVSEGDDGRFGELSKVMLDHAMLAEGAKLENPADYVQRINKLLLGVDRTADEE